MLNKFLGACSAASLLLMVTAGTQADPRESWMASEIDGKSVLSFGVPDSPEEVTLVLTCEASGGVELFIARGSEKLKPGASVDFTLSIGTAKSNFRGAALLNLLDGIPSVRAIGGYYEPVFQALTKGGTLLMMVGTEKTSISLASFGKKAKTLWAKCKPEDQPATP